MKRDESNKILNLNVIRRKAWKKISVPLDKLGNDQKWWIGFVFLCLLTTFLISNPVWRSTAAEYQEGDIARESVIAPADISRN